MRVKEQEMVEYQRGFEKVFRQIVEEANRLHDRWRSAAEAVEKDPSEENMQALAAAGQAFGGDIQSLKERRQAKADRLITAAIEEFYGSETMDAETFGTLAAYTGRVYGPQALHHLDHFKVLSTEAYAKVVPSVWGMAEYPGIAMSRAEWRKMWKKAGFVGEGQPRPTEPITLYRASFPAHKGNMSWTDDLARAKWFQQARGSRSRLYQIIAPPERLLARIHEDGRGESEWVVDTRSLTIEEIG